MRPVKDLNVDAQSVLIVDDTPANIRLLTVHLEAHGLTVSVAHDGAEGVMRAQIDKPDLILLDVMMPGMDGLSACRMLIQDPATADFPVIFMSALSDTGSKICGFKAGGVDYLTKPFQMEEVLARVSTHLSLRRLQRQLAAQNEELQRQIEVRKHMEEKLQSAYEDLEGRVLQRTAELAHVNASLEKENSERKQAEQRIRYMAHYDALTGIANRI